MALISSDHTETWIFKFFFLTLLLISALHMFFLYISKVTGFHYHVSDTLVTPTMINLGIGTKIVNYSVYPELLLMHSLVAIVCCFLFLEFVFLDTSSHLHNSHSHYFFYKSLLIIINKWFDETMNKTFRQFYLSSTPHKNYAKCDSWLKSLHIFIFYILFEMS